MSPAQALAYLFWTRHRRDLTILGVYWFVVMILCLALPAGAFTLPPSGTLPPVLMVVFFPGSCIVAVVGYLLGVFTFSQEGRLEGWASSFPARLWTLPLPTHVLVAWPMLWGSALVILVCLTLALAVRPLCSFDVPLFWPGLLSAVLLAWWQALLWTPFPLPWLRAFVLIFVSTVLLCAPMAVLAFEVPSTAVCVLLAVLLLAAYGIALQGVARARRGDQGEWNWPAWLRWSRAPRTRPAFPSAARAQLWFEWRLHGLSFPLSIASVAVIALPMILIFAESFNKKSVDLLTASLQERGNLWLPVGGVMVCILSMVWAAGAEMSRLGRGTCRLSSFLATRPVSEAMLVRTKLVAAAWSTLAGWGVLAAGLLLWLALNGHAAAAAQQFEALRQRQEPGLFWGRLVFLVGGAIVLTWLQMVQLMWIGLSGSTRVIAISASGFFALIVLIAFSFLLPDHPDYWPVFVRLLPWLAGAAVLLKILAAAWSLHTIQRRRLIPSVVLWGTLAIWLALAAGLFAALYALLPDNWFSVPGVILGSVLLLPLTRLALAPLALSWNRHR